MDSPKGSADQEDLAQLNTQLAELNERLETHLELLRLDQEAGGQVQRKLLPAHRQTINGVSCDYWLQPALYLSGDFLDFQRFDDRFTLFYFADVAGNGASSAFVTVLLKLLFNRWLSEWDATQAEAMPARWLAQLNRELLDTGIGKHATLFVGVIDSQTRELHYSLGAQLPKALVVKKQSVLELPGEGMPVGLFADAEYPRLTYRLPPKFRLWLCSDGVLDCVPGATLDLRLKEIERRVQASTSLEGTCAGLPHMIPHVLAAQGGESWELSDDLTIMVLSGFTDDHE